MSAEALPLPSLDPAWRNTSRAPRPLTAEAVAACPVADPSDHAAHAAALPKLLTQAVWQDTAKPFGLVEMVYDALDEAEMRLEALVEAAAAEATETDQAIDWPHNEPSDWS